MDQVRLYVTGESNKIPKAAIIGVDGYKGHADGKYEHMQRGPDKWSLFVYVDATNAGKTRSDIAAISGVESVQEG